LEDFEGGKTKTRNSEQKLPMNPVLRDALLQWKVKSPFNQPGDFVFPSARLKGKKPLSMMEVFKRKIKPVIEALGYAQPGDAYGWHAFRHGAGTALWDLTRDKLTVRDLLRHGNSGNITELYMHGVDPRLEAAQDKLVDAIFATKSKPSPIPQAKVMQMPRRSSAG
jgi:integrase